MMVNILSKIMIRLTSFFIVLVMIFFSFKDFELTMFEIEIFHPIHDLKVGYKPASSHQGLYIIQDNESLFELFGESVPHFAIYQFNKDFFKKYTIVGYIIYTSSEPSLVLKDLTLDHGIIHFEFFQCSDCLRTADRKLYQEFFVIQNRYLSDNPIITSNIFG